MTPDLLALSRQLAALPGAPEPGLGSAYRGPDGKMRVRDNTGLLWLADPDQPGSTPLAEERFLLDLADPTGATTGCLAACCRGLYGDPLLYALPDLAGEWCIMRRGRSISPSGDDMIAEGPTEPAAWREAILTHPSLKDVR